MQFLAQLSKCLALSFSLVNCTSFAVLSQTAQPATLQANIIRTDAKPAIFAPGVISTTSDEFAPSFTPDGNTVYFSGASSAIYFSKLVNGIWGEPKIATFSGRWEDMDPFISPDGKRLFFSSRRPMDSAQEDKPQKNAHIWYVDHLSGNNWSPPHHLAAPVNLEGIDNYAPSVSRSGTLYFFSPNRDINNKGKSYYSKWDGNHFDEPKVLSLNGDNGVRDPYISPDERYLVFISGTDLYISYSNNNGWSAGEKLSLQVNNGAHNYSPYLSRDGKMLYYSSEHIHGILMIPINIPQ
ncbi:MAG: translocation protein TolB [Mucilaginibacter sp.]|nr:translocation protein TolB [Mucilaginibacter sp.]